MKVLPTRGSQNVQVAECVISVADTMEDVAGVVQDMTAVTTGQIFKAMNLPPNAEIIGGEVQVEVQGVGPTAYTVQVGTYDGSSFTGTYSSTVDLLGAVGARTALTLTVAAISGTLNNIYLRLIRSVAVATAGKFVVRVMYVQRGKIDESVPS